MRRPLRPATFSFFLRRFRPGLTAMSIFGAVLSGVFSVADGAVVQQVFHAGKFGIKVWSSDTGNVQLLTDFPSYEIELSPDGKFIYIGNGGADSVASGIFTQGI